MPKLDYIFLALVSFKGRAIKINSHLISLGGEKIEWKIAFLHFPLLYCMIVTNFLIVQFSFFILLLASWQILILVLSTRPAKVASRCRDLNPGSSACLAEMLPLD